MLAVICLYLFFPGTIGFTAAHTDCTAKTGLESRQALRPLKMALAVFCLLLFFPRTLGFTIAYLGCMVETGLEKDALRDAGGAVELEPETESDERISRPPPVDLSERRGPFKTLTGQTDTMTVQICVERCWLHFYDYAALQSGSRCYCSRSAAGLVKLDDQLCYVRCSGNCNQRCGGGTLALSVYETGYERIVVPSTRSIRQYYFGCFNSDEVIHLCTQKGYVKKPPIASGRMNPFICAQYCFVSPKAMPFAVISAPDSCCCGTLLGSWHEDASVSISGAMCKAPCIASDNDDPCAGHNTVSAYNIQSWTKDTPPEISLTMWEDFTPERGILWPQFPANMTFEVTEYHPKLEFHALTTQGPAAESQQIVDAANTGVGVADEPEEAGSSVGFIIGVLLSCLAVGGAMFFVVFRKKPTDNLSETEKAIALLQTGNPEDGVTAGDGGVHKKGEGEVEGEAVNELQLMKEGGKKESGKKTKKKKKQKNKEETETSTLSESSGDESDSLTKPLLS